MSHSQRSTVTTARLAFFALIAAAAAAGWAQAGDWPQILGPHRDGKADGERIAEAWAGDGPAVVWQRDVGSGYAGVAVRGSTVVLFHRKTDKSIAEALDALSGRPRWKATFPARYVASITADDGPRCVPLIHADRVYLHSAEGDVHCVALADGNNIWSRQLAQDYRALEGYFGAGSTPLVEGDKLLVNLGGRDQSGIVALALTDGRTIWKATAEQASYSSPVAVTVDGTRHAIFVTRLSVVSLDPSNGAVRFRFPFGMRGPTVNAATPLVIDRHLFVTANYGVGAVLAKIQPAQAVEVWKSDEVLSSQYTTPITIDGYLYGIDGRQDAGVARLRCVRATDGKAAWTEEGFGTGHLLLADGKLVVVKTDGTLAIVRPRSDKYRELLTAKLSDNTIQALPALSEGRLYVRDTQTLRCFDLRPRAEQSGQRKK